MKVFIKFDFRIICNKILEEQLDKAGIKFKINGFGEVEFLETVSAKEKKKLSESIKEYGMSIIENQKTVLVQKIKDSIVHMIRSEEQVHVKASIYLSEKLGHSYGYISNVFSEVTYTSIEHFIILQKIEYAKQLLIMEDFSLTDVANRLNYSSVAHLSTQFKNTTGITPSQFQKIVKKRREISNNKNISDE